MFLFYQQPSQNLQRKGGGFLTKDAMLSIKGHPWAALMEIGDRIINNAKLYMHLGNPIIVGHRP